jgi:hypothetical protein
MKNFSSLKLKDIISIILVFGLGFFWVHVDQHLIPGTWGKFVALIVVLLFLFYMQFFVNKPVNIYHYANTISLLSVLFVMVTSTILHVIINHNFNIKLILIWIFAGVLPYISAVIYNTTKKKN